MSYGVLHDPEALLAEELPLDRTPVTALADAILARKNVKGLRAGDCAQIALLLTGHARVVAAEVGRRFENLPKDSDLRPLIDQVLQEAERRLSVTSRTTLAYAQQRARLVKALYRALDRLPQPRPAPEDS
ncbi:DUF6415 family natural product biosynthesis protein [Streptomyces sp. ML-6]|uniref:DUF6415 family natural product biosynthesis protein n=1 Tax=Streptomyces sp. ML-6 TaxID=2982693 RepID=UPI0024C01E19|nr:DUF6415 family natural product biosynthesis protein [Streptomyces sp. ML-6]MDK0524783.1 DUF6415 family natural product biosynthesis protein [Streptomyces sp. ML-6]